MVVSPVYLQRSLLFSEIHIILNDIEKLVVDIFQIRVQIFVGGNIFVLVFRDFILRKTFGFNEKRKLPDKKLVQFFDALKQILNSVVNVGFTWLKISVESL